MRNILRQLGPFKWPVVITLVMVFIQSLAELYLPTLMADIVDTGIVHADTNYILRVGGLMLLVAIASMTCSILVAFLSSRIGMGFGRRLRSKVFSRVEEFSLHEFDQFGTATLITRTTNDITQVQTFVMMMFRMMVAAPVMSIGGIVMAVSTDAELSLTLVVVVPILVLVILIIAAKGSVVFRKMQEKIDKLNLVLRESLIGIRVIRAFNRVPADRARFAAANKDLADTAFRAQRIMATMMPFMMIVMNITTIAIIWFGGLRIDAGHMQVGSMMAFLQYAMQILFSLMMMSFMFVMLPRATVSAGRINQVLETKAEIADPVTPLSIASSKGVVEFHDVVFRYPGAEEPALEGISFRAEPGKVTAIIGGTGSGKSTLVGLIPRFYDVESGSVTLDGTDVRSLTQEDLRARLGFVPQKAVLFSDTVAGNIRYGKSDASDEEIREASRIAQASGFIDTLAEGYDSPVTQGGANLSGGQKQRLSIARALARKPEVYIFDDSFSALDFKTDAALRQALKGATRSSTVIIVAQRVSTIMDADQIIVLDEGKIAGIGGHRALLKDCPVYREIVESQLSEEEIA